MMVKKPRKPTKKETEQLINLLLKKDDTGFEKREDIAADVYNYACIAVFDVDKDVPEGDNKEMILMWPRNRCKIREATQAFFWQRGKLYEERINP